MKVRSIFCAVLYDWPNFDTDGDWEFGIGPGDYTLRMLQAKGFQNDNLSSMHVKAYNTASNPTPQCMAKETRTLSGSANAGTELVCALDNRIDDGLDTLDQWVKVYGAGNEVYSFDSSLLAVDTLPLKDFYICRNCLYLSVYALDRASHRVPGI